MSTEDPSVLPPALRSGRHGTSLLRTTAEGVLVEHRRLSSLPAAADERIEILGRISAIQRLIGARDIPGALPILQADLLPKVPWLELPVLATNLTNSSEAPDPLELWRTLADTLVSIHRLGFSHNALCPSHVLLHEKSVFLDATGLDCGQKDLADVNRFAAPEGSGLPGDVYALGMLIGAFSRQRDFPLSTAHQALLSAMQAPALEQRPSMPEVAQSLGIQLPTPAPVETDAPTLAGSSSGRIRASSAATPQSRLGRYELIRLLGKGGMGSVFYGRDVVCDRPVAIKVLNGGQDSDRAIKRFFREAKLLATISSPYVARAIDTNVDGSQHYLVMELLEGENLRQRLHRDPHISVEQALTWGTHLARGLADIHRHGIVHRDLKPANVMLVEREGEVTAVLCDFGVARAYEGTDTQLTSDGALIGTPEFMAPEQVSGAIADPRSDVYALGLTLYAMLTGNTPFHDRKGVTALLAAQLQDVPAPVSERRPEVGDRLEDLIARALAKNPLDRPMDAEALLEELEGLLRGTPPSTMESRPELPQEEGVRSYVVERTLRANIEELWPHVSNTDQMSRALGLGSVDGERRVGTEGVETYGVSNTFGFDLRWREHPFEWVAPTRFGVLREFTKGPLNWYRIIVDLEPVGDDQTKITHRIEASPRGLFGEIAAWFELGLRTKPGLDRLYKRLERVLEARRTNPASFEHPYQKGERLSRTRTARLERIETEMHKRQVNDRVMTRLGEALRHGNAQALARLRPRAFAKRHGLPEQEVLKACLHATDLGALVMRWDVICPSCRVAAEMVNTMDKVRAHTTCSACGTAFGVNLSNSIELVFQSHSQVRQCDPKTYCLGGPSHVPHIVSQVALGPGERFQAETRLAEGTYQVSGRGMVRHWTFRVDPWARSSRLDVALRAGFSLDRPRHVATGKQRLTIANDFSEPMIVRIEKASGQGDAITAAEVMTHPLFRELFPSEVLSQGVQVSLSNVVILIVELADYPEPDATAGDMPLFSSLSSLRTLVEAAVHREGGTAIKLYRSGLMAVFQEPTAGARAALHALQETQAQEVRMSITSGPAMATTVNNRLDYFGRFVTEGESLLSETPKGALTVSDRVLNDPAVSELVARWRPRLQVDQGNFGGVVLRRGAPAAGSVVPLADSRISEERHPFETPTP